MKWRVAVSWVSIYFLSRLIAGPNYAAAAPIHDFGAWMGVFYQNKLSEKFGLYLEEQVRLNNHVTGGNRLILRPGIQYYFNPKLSVTLGYAWTPNFSPFRNENRLWQQVQHSLNASSYQLINRFRFEERKIENTVGVGLRIRYLIRSLIYLNQNERRLALCLSEEAFFELNDISGGPPPGFDQNRLFLGLNYKVNDELTLESGYLNLYDTYTSEIVDLLNHNYVLNLYLNF